MKLHKHKERGIYFAQFNDADRQPRQKRIYFTKNRRESNAMLNDYLERMAKGLVDPWGESPVERALTDKPEKPTPLSSALEMFLTEKRNHKLRESTVVRYRNAIEPFVDMQPKDRMVHEVTRKAISDYCYSPRKRDGKERATATIRTTIDRMGIFFRWCADCGYAKKDPTKSIDTPQKDRNETDYRYITKNQARRLLQVVREINHPHHWWVADMIEFITLTGLRRAEICALQWKHIICTNKGGRICFTMDDYWEIPLKSEHSVRNIKLNIRAMEILNDLRRERGAVHEDDYIWMDHNGPFRGREEVSSKTIKRYIRKAHLGDMNMHGLRHTAITWWCNDGIPLHVAKEMAGHSDIGITQRYLHADLRDIDQAIPDAVMDFRL